MNSDLNTADTNPQAAGSTRRRAGVRGEYTESNRVLWLYGANEEPSASDSLQPAANNPPAPVLCVPLVPGYMTATDFLSFTGSHQSSITHTLAVRHAHASSGSTLALRFTTHAAAQAFQKTFNGRTFSPLEPERCTVGFVHGVMLPGKQAGHPLDVFSLQGQDTCAVCLEPLDAPPLLTIMCRHTFHARCLGRWGDGACPVCRGRQTAAFVDHEAVRGLGLEVQPGDSACQKCGRTDDLWICLVCGDVGCGRYASGHAKDHFAQSSHPYAMKIDSQAVWDYAGDGYVHRVLHAAGDGKLVALESSEDTPEKHPEDSEQSSLLAARLASLNDHHAEEMQRQARELRLQATREIEALQAEHARDMAAQQAQHERAIGDLQAGWTAERTRLETQLARARTQAEECQRLLDEEREISRALVARLEEAAERERGMEGRVGELEEHVRDLSFFISTQEAVARPGAEELQGASIVAPQQPPPQPHRKPRTTGGKRRIPR